jgi:hypothetical protein
MGIESGMTGIGKFALIAAVALGLLSPVTAGDADAAKKSRARTKFTVHPKYPAHGKGHWRGYGFLPGYRQPPDLTDWRTPRTPDRPEYRYWRNGHLEYGWGWPGYYRGRYNGGSFGPCWTSTPIGMMWNCGR